MQKFDACEWFGRRKRRGESSWWVRRHLPEASPRTPPGVRGEVGCVACSTHLPESGVRLAVSATLSKRTLRRAFFYEAPADLFRPKRERENLSSTPFAMPPYSRSRRWGVALAAGGAAAAAGLAWYWYYSENSLEPKEDQEDDDNVETNGLDRNRNSKGQENNIGEENGRAHAHAHGNHHNGHANGHDDRGRDRPRSPSQHQLDINAHVDAHFRSIQSIGRETTVGVRLCLCLCSSFLLLLLFSSQGRAFARNHATTHPHPSPRFLFVRPCSSRSRTTSSPWTIWTRSSPGCSGRSGR